MPYYSSLVLVISVHHIYHDFRPHPTSSIHPKFSLFFQARNASNANAPTPRRRRRRRRILCPRFSQTTVYVPSPINSPTFFPVASAYQRTQQRSVLALAGHLPYIQPPTFYFHLRSYVSRLTSHFRSQLPVQPVSLLTQFFLTLFAAATLGEARRMYER